VTKKESFATSTPGRRLRRVALPIGPLLGRVSSGYVDTGGSEHGPAETAEAWPGDPPQVAAHFLRH
jgi:hypothetical protein